MELDEILKQYSKKLNFKQLFLRDMAMSSKGFLYFLISFLFSTISINFIIAYLVNYYSESPETTLIYSFLAFCVLLSILLAGIIIDFSKNRITIILISSVLTLIGFSLVLFNGIISLIGVSIILFFTGIFIIDLIIILIHESNILNRGRLLGYFFFLSFIFSHLFILYSINNLLLIFLIQFFIILCLFWISKLYEYKETNERLYSDLKFTKVFGSLHITGYLAAIMTLAFVLGNSYQIEYGLNIITPLFVIFFIGTFLVMGISLDNMGRKWTLASSVLVISAIILFAGMINNNEIYISVFFGVSVPASFMIVFTFCGDFTTERNKIRYRARLTSLFLITLIGGFVFGLMINYAFTQTYLKTPSLFFWIPSLLEGLSPFLLILLLVWILPLPEILTAKEADWKESLKNIYVFNSASVCLYTQDFKPDNANRSVLSEDLITGGFTGILSLISEITNEQKTLRIIDKQGVKIYFSYGKSIIVALISTKTLPILFKKLELFTKAFEKKYESELESFNGKINVFEDANHLIERFFN